MTDFSISSVRGDIEFRNVTVYYPGSEQPVLSNIDLDIPAGQTLAIVGPTGSGKTTLVNLVPRLIDPREGQILVDGIDARKIPLEVLRSAIGLVPQETLLFRQTVHENIAFGRPEAEDWQVAEAARVADIERDVEEFPEGFQTVVAERGITLSGGQKQRTALARAILRDPRILILDDSLSSVDTVTEERILTQLRVLMRNRTTLMISHRVSTARYADQIVVLAGGRIRERGTHEELLALEGHYFRLHQKQLIEEELERV